MMTFKLLIFLPVLAIAMLEKVSAEDGNQLCYPGDNITIVSKADSKLNLKFKTIRKPTLDGLLTYWGHVSNPMSDLIFGRPKMPETDTTHQCHPFSDELSNLLMEEYQFSWMEIVSDVQIIDGNPWWCKGHGTLNHPQPFDENLGLTHICYPKYWTDGIGNFRKLNFMCDLQHWDQIILRKEKELIWRCIPFEFWCQDIDNYDLFVGVIVMFLFFGILVLILSLIGKVIDLLVNRFIIFGTWTAPYPQPLIGPNLPKPAPAA